jgi:hypothetical protein
MVVVMGVQIGLGVVVGLGLAVVLGQTTTTLLVVRVVVKVE